MNGLHILAEFHDCDCDPALLAGAEALAKLCRETCADAGLTPVAEVFHQFAGGGATDGQTGATGAVILAESHLAIHTWPELSAVTLDLYVCNFSRDNRAAAATVFAKLQDAYRPRRIERREITRGS